MIISRIPPFLDSNGIDDKLLDCVNNAVDNFISKFPSLLKKQFDFRALDREMKVLDKLWLQSSTPDVTIWAWFWRDSPAAYHCPYGRTEVPNELKPAGINLNCEPLQIPFWMIESK